MSLPHFLHIVINFTYSAYEKYHLTKQLILCISFVLIFSEFFKSVQNVQSRHVKCGLREQICCSMFKVDRCSMYPGSLPLIFNGSVPGHEKLYMCIYILNVIFHCLVIVNGYHHTFRIATVPYGTYECIDRNFITLGNSISQVL